MNENIKNQYISNFDKELIDYKNGIIGDSHIFNLGKPSEILQKCGFPPHDRIELASARLKLKSQQTNHPFDIEDLIGLDKALKSPIAVFEYGDKNKSQNVIVNLEKDDKNFLVGVFFNQKQRGYEVSDIRGLFNRDNIDWIRWIEQGKMIYGNKEKIQVSIAQQRTNLAEVNNQDVRTSSDTYYLDSTESILLKFGDVNDIFTNDFEFYKEQKDRNEVFKKFRNYYAQNDSLDFDVAKFQSDEFYDALENKNIEILKRYTSFDDNYEISNLAREILSEKLGITEIKTPEELEIYLNQFGTNIKENDMENYVITQERNGEISVLASSYKNAIFVGGDYLSDYETYNLEKVNNLLKDLQESNPDNEYRIMTENDFRQKYLLEENKLSPTEYLALKINTSGINIHLNKDEMKQILEMGKDIQKKIVKYGTNEDIDINEEQKSKIYGTYIVSENEENAKNYGKTIAGRKYGNQFYIKNTPLKTYLEENNFSPYWQKFLEQINTNSKETLEHELVTLDVKGNKKLEDELHVLTVLTSSNVIEYKQEKTYLYSVEIPNKENGNYLPYNEKIGEQNAEKINEELKKLNQNWIVEKTDTGKKVYENILTDKVFKGNKKATSLFLSEKCGIVGLEVSNTDSIILSNKDIEITDKIQYMQTQNGELYGFTYQNEIYIDEDLVNSNVLAHEYTHIWDSYVQTNNPELWNKGITCFKNTSLWNEIIEDENYQNLKTDDEILSECHARIVGKMAEQVLQRIAARDGELTKDKIIDWDKEVNEYVATELLIKPELGDENYISESVKAEYLKEFLSMPMKDLMNEVKLKIENEQPQLQKYIKNLNEENKEPINFFLQQKNIIPNYILNPENNKVYKGATQMYLQNENIKNNERNSMYSPYYEALRNGLKLNPEKKPTTTKVKNIENQKYEILIPSKYFYKEGINKLEQAYPQRIQNRQPRLITEEKITIEKPQNNKLENLLEYDMKKYWACAFSKTPYNPSVDYNKTPYKEQFETLIKDHRKLEKIANETYENITTQIKTQKKSNQISEQNNQIEQTTKIKGRR